MVRDFFPLCAFVPRRASAVTHLVLLSDTLSDLCLIGSWKLKLFLFYGGVSLRVNAEPLQSIASIYPLPSEPRDRANAQECSCEYK